MPPRTPPTPRLTPILALLLFAGLPASSSLSQPARTPAPDTSPAVTPADDLPIRRITLYRSGVGFFQREATVSDAARAQLRFDTDQINDVLKSMVLLDLDGGRIGTVSYASKDPLSRRLASFGVNIAGNPSMPELLNSLRGSEISVTATEGTFSGVILGVESRKIPPSGDHPAAELPYLNLLTPGGVRSVPVIAITSFELLDKELAGELNKALAALAEHRAENTKSVDLAFDGQGARRVVVAYVHEMPVWKTSYRLILPPSENEPRASASGRSNEPRASATGRSPSSPPAAAPSSLGTLQAWAIVENTTDADWTDIRLSLVAGRPVSFQMDLYEPLYVSRPEIPVPMIAGVMPREYQAGVDLSLGREVAANADGARKARRNPQSLRELPAPAAAAEGDSLADSRFYDANAGSAGRTQFGLSADDLANYAATAQGAAAEIGEVFQYELQTPVTIERQRSAMIPLITAPIQTRRVSIFTPADQVWEGGSGHPMRGVEITNTAGGDGEPLQLLPGPISVFESGESASGEGGATYAGDAQIGHIAPGDKRLLAYAVDLDVAVLTKPDSASTVTRLRLVDGLVELTTVLRNAVTYGFENKDGRRPRTILVEHPRLDGWDLVEPAEPAETTQALYRFEVEAAPGESETITVVQERTERQRIAVTNFDLPTILAYHRDGKLSDRVLEAFREAAARQSAINDSVRLIAELDREIASIAQDQDRIRENMQTVERTSTLYARYMTKLTDQETRLETLTEQRAQEQQRLDERRTDLNNFLRALNIE